MRESTFTNAICKAESKQISKDFAYCEDALGRAENAIGNLPSAQPEQPPYVAEIEAEYQKAVKMPHIHKPLAKALYEVWKKHDREDAERQEK